MRRRMLPLGLLCIAASACNDSPAPYVFGARIVDGRNGNPAAGTDATILRIGIQQGELAAREYEYPIDAGNFDASVELVGLTPLTRIRVEIEGAATKLLTAPPAFVPLSTNGVLRAVTAAPSSCERVTFDQLEAPRAFFGMVQSGTFALIVGGTVPSQPQVEFLDALEWESRLFSEDFSLSDLGETRAASIDEGTILVLPTKAGPFVFDMVDVNRRITPVVLHNGAGPRSALVSVRGVGAMIIGGELAGEPQSGVSLVEAGGKVTSLQLSVPRAGAAATALGRNVLVAGGNVEGNAEILAEGAATGQPILHLLDGVRESGLLVGDGESRALWMGGRDEVGALRQDTVRFDGCPAACVPSSGPTWLTARSAALQPPWSTLVIGGEGSKSVDEVRWSGADVTIDSLLTLEVPRAGAGGIVLESGAFIVAGGQDGTSIRDDFEFCVPSALAPL
ncbi:MAG: hypothetical protein WBM46_06775 [Polyangiales bacterium]